MTFSNDDILKVKDKYQVNDQMAVKILSNQKAKELINQLPDDDKYKQILELLITII